MARSRTRQPPVAEALPIALEPIPTVPAFRRAKLEDAMEVARATFLHGERLDMGTLAAQLAVSRATLYRWCGSRELLHERILEQRAREFGEWARAETAGEDTERVLAALGLILEATAAAQPVRRFMEREPHLALRILTRRDGAVLRMLTDTLYEIAAETCAEVDRGRLRDEIDVAVHVGSTLQWASVAIGEEPPTDYILEILRRQMTP
jgi:AcrR family transcriptional regulator